MCKECGRAICPPSCPEYCRFIAGRGSALTVCALCDGSIFSGETYYVKDGDAICSYCRERMSMDELELLCGTDDILPLCGFERKG